VQARKLTGAILLKRSTRIDKSIQLVEVVSIRPRNWRETRVTKRSSRENSTKETVSRGILAWSGGLSMVGRFCWRIIFTRGRMDASRSGQTNKAINGARRRTVISSVLAPLHAAHSETPQRKTPQTSIQIRVTTFSASDAQWTATLERPVGAV
jgi:hypothetical protein